MLFAIWSWTQFLVPPLAPSFLPVDLSLWLSCLSTKSLCILMSFLLYVLKMPFPPLRSSQFSSPPLPNLPSPPFLPPFLSFFFPPSLIPPLFLSFSIHSSGLSSNVATSLKPSLILSGRDSHSVPLESLFIKLDCPWHLLWFVIHIPVLLHLQSPSCTFTTTNNNNKRQRREFNHLWIPDPRMAVESNCGHWSPLNWISVFPLKDSKVL